MTQAALAPSGLAELTTLVRDCSVSGVGRRVLLIRTDLLPPRLAQPHHLRLAYEALEPLSGADRARRHALSRGRLAISWRGEATSCLQQALAALDHLLLDAPLEAPPIAELARLFDLPNDGAALLAIADRAGETVTTPAADAGPAPEPPPVASPRRPLDLPMIELIEAQLATANVARFARRRSVCQLGPDRFISAWESRFLSIQELIVALCPDRNPYAEPWLFRRLTRTLDRRLLALLSSPAELRDAGPLGLDLNVGGVLSPEFLRFDAALAPALRGKVILSLHPADVMGDLPSFRFACAFARARGYRIMLRGASPSLLPLVDLAALELDYVELRWSPTLFGFDPADLGGGTARWLLSRANDAGALRWGRAAGITLFAGDAVQPGAGLVRMRSAA